MTPKGITVNSMTLGIIRIGLRVLTDRMLTILSLFMTFALTCWVMYQPTWERQATAAFFAVFVFIPCIVKERKSNDQAES